jgi:hypothetical protein
MKELSQALSRQKIIWATRGYDWGYRFLLDGDQVDPLVTLESVLPISDSESAEIAHQDGLVAARFPDPEGRTDKAGRHIWHYVVAFPPASSEITSVTDVLDSVWPLLADDYASRYK